MGLGILVGTRLLWEKTQHTHEVINCCINITEIWATRCGVWFPDASSQVLEDCMFLFAFRHNLLGMLTIFVDNHTKCCGKAAGVYRYIYIYIYLYMYVCVNIHMLHPKKRLSIYRILHTSCQLTPPRESLKSVSYTSPACLFNNCEATI